MNTFVTPYLYCLFPSPLGRIALIADDTHIVGLTAHGGLEDWIEKQDSTRSRIVMERRSTSLLSIAQKQILEYFEGRRKEFALPLLFYGTPFQKKVWHTIAQIPYGATCTYGQIAREIGTKAVQAVGTAVGRNPIPIIVPCHRVLPANGSLGNFSFSCGPMAKQYLLNLEGHNFPDPI